MVASFANVYLTDKLGFGVVRSIFISYGDEELQIAQMMVIGSTVQMLGYVLNSTAPPFPAFAFAYFLGGFGVAIQDAGSSGYVTSLKSSTRMGILQGVYGTPSTTARSFKYQPISCGTGLGALCAPLVSTQFAQLRHWSFHYLVSLGLSVVNTVLLMSVFRLRRQEGILSFDESPYKN